MYIYLIIWNEERLKSIIESQDWHALGTCMYVYIYICIYLACMHELHRDDNFTSLGFSLSEKIKTFD